MSDLHKKEFIDAIEEGWQKRCYHMSGDLKNYIHKCEICNNINSIIRIPGGHYLCIDCKKKLKLPKEKTLIEWGKRGIRLFSKEERFKPFHPASPSKELKTKAWKKVIIADYNIEILNNNFKYEQ
jgi:hypothetical protein